MLTITTTYHKPTNTKGARIAASVTRAGKRHTVTRGYDYARNALENHRSIAEELAETIAYDRPLFLGETPRGYQWKTLIPATSPVHIPRPPVTARPRGWAAVEELPGAAGQGDRITVGAYVSPDGLTAVQYDAGYHSRPEKERARRFAVSVILNGEAWVTKYLESTRGAKRVAACAAAIALTCAAIHAEHTDAIAALANARKGSQAWRDAAEEIRLAYVAAGLY
jgi:hypothetical protein